MSGRPDPPGASTGDTAPSATGGARAARPSAAVRRGAGSLGLSFEFQDFGGKLGEGAFLRGDLLHFAAQFLRTHIVHCTGRSEDIVAPCILYAIVQPRTVPERAQVQIAEEREAFTRLMGHLQVDR